MIKTEDIKELGEFIKIKLLCQKAGLKYNTIAAKMKRNSPLKTTESEALELALTDYFELIKKKLKL
jgi:hypothetical protein